MDLKRIKPSELPKDVREVYQEIKTSTDNFDKDVVPYFKDEIKDLISIITCDFPSAIEPEKNPETKTKIIGNPVNKNQFSKWLKQNIGTKVFLASHPDSKNVGEWRKIVSVKSKEFEMVDRDKRTTWVPIPAASKMSFSEAGFSFGNGITMVYKKKDAKPSKIPTKKTSTAVKKTLANIKKRADMRSQTKGRTDSDIVRDMQRTAKSTGKRIAKSGNTYYEHRPNRVDINRNIRLRHGGNLGGLTSVDVIFKDPKYNYSTSMSPTTTEKSAREYFVGNSFNVAPFPNEQFEKVIDIKFHPAKPKPTVGVVVQDTPDSPFRFIAEDISRETAQKVIDDYKSSGKEYHAIQIDDLPFKKGGNVRSNSQVTLTNSEFTPSYKVISIETTDGRIFDYPMSGAYIVDPQNAKQDPSQISIKFKTGGSMPNNAIYIPAYRVAKMVVDELEGDDLKEIDGSRILNGFWFQTTDRQQKLLDEYYASINKKQKGGNINTANATEKFTIVMREFGKGQLKSGSSDKVVTDRNQAVAIAYSEARKIDKEFGKKSDNDICPSIIKGQTWIDGDGQKLRFKSVSKNKASAEVYVESLEKWVPTGSDTKENWTDLICGNFKLKK